MGILYDLSQHQLSASIRLHLFSLNKHFNIDSFVSGSFYQSSGKEICRVPALILSICRSQFEILLDVFICFPLLVNHTSFCKPSEVPLQLFKVHLLLPHPQRTALLSWLCAHSVFCDFSFFPFTYIVFFIHVCVLLLCQNVFLKANEKLTIYHSPSQYFNGT